MKCWNCLKQVPEKAKVCPYCEKRLDEEPTEEQQQAVREMFAGMPADVRDELLGAMGPAGSAEEFANAIFVGDCPKCGSSDVGCCDEDPEIDNPLVGRCLSCGHYWCTECRRALDPKKPECPCWEEE